MNNFLPAPIVIFSYNRLAHLKIVISALKKNYLAKSSELIIFSDGPKKNIKNENTKILEIRNYLHKINGFKKITIINRSKNLGLSKNVITGISQVIKKYKKVIVLEDDLVPNKFFLKYMNSGLKIYKNNKNVASIHAYVYPIDNINKKINHNTFFIKGADCWGWATWLRAWNTFDKNGKKLIYKIKKKKLISSFNFNNSYNYFQMLQEQVEKKNNSWAIRWYASCFLRDMYTLYPAISLIKNIGIDQSGSNSKFDLLNLGNKKLSKIDYKIKKQPIKESDVARKLFENFFKKKKLFRLKNILKKILNV
jgi:hypothetical protein